MTVPALDSALLRSFPRLFLHFFDTHFLEAKGALNPHPHAGFVSEFRRATRMAVATADKVILPAASYVESEICSSVVNELKELFAFGVITIAGHTPNFQEFHYEKRSEYRRGSRQYSAYQAIDPTDLHPPFLERGRSATSDIGAHWNQALEEGSAIAGLVKDTGVVLPSDFERRWQQVPERLGKLAFIVDHVEELLGEEIRQPSIRYRLHDIINEGYFRSYTLDLKAGVVTDLVYLDAHFEVPSFSENLSYKRLLREIQRAELLHYLDTCSAIELLELRQNPAWLECVHATKSDFTITGAIHPHGILVRSNLMHKLRSFIAHGHDRGLLFELKDYLQTTLHFPEPIILEQQPDRGLTIIEKFETYANGIDDSV